MTDSNDNALQKLIADGFSRVEERLSAMESRMEEGFADVHLALFGLMDETLRPSEVDEIRSRMKNPPDRKQYEIPGRKVVG